MTTKNQIELVDGRQKIKENKERERERVNSFHDNPNFVKNTQIDDTN